jgi:hypothetical protein
MAGVAIPLAFITAVAACDDAERGATGPLGSTEGVESWQIT